MPLIDYSPHTRTALRWPIRQLAPVLSSPRPVRSAPFSSTCHADSSLADPLRRSYTARVPPVRPSAALFDMPARLSPVASHHVATIRSGSDRASSTSRSRSAPVVPLLASSTCHAGTSLAYSLRPVTSSHHCALRFDQPSPLAPQHTGSPRFDYSIPGYPTHNISTCHPSTTQVSAGQHSTKRRPNSDRAPTTRYLTTARKDRHHGHLQTGLDNVHQLPRHAANPGPLDGRRTERPEDH